MTRGRALVATLLATALLASCGDDDGDEAPAPGALAAETVDSVPKLPPDWKEHVNRAGGFAIGLPPGWKARDRGTTTEIRSFDGLVVLSVTADRTGEAQAIDVGEAATRTLASLSGFADPIEPGRPRELEHRYEAAEVSGQGRSAGNGLEQDLTVVVLRRGELVTTTVLIAANADKRAKPARRIADRVVQTLRTQPPNAAVR
jgi:hypothetical protein